MSARPLVRCAEPLATRRAPWKLYGSHTLNDGLSWHSCGSGIVVGGRFFECTRRMSWGDHLSELRELLEEAPRGTVGWVGDGTRLEFYQLRREERDETPDTFTDARGIVVPFPGEPERKAA